jgi:hypothetical protein
MKAAGSRFRRRLGGPGKMLTGNLLAHDLRMERDWFGVLKGFNIGLEKLDNRQRPCLVTRSEYLDHGRLSSWRLLKVLLYSATPIILGTIHIYR